MKTHVSTFHRIVLTAITSIGLSYGLQAQQDAVTKEDKEFLKNASELGLTEQQLGKLASEKGNSPEVKALGKKLVSDHKKTNADLEKLAKSKKVELDMKPTAAQKQMISAFENKSGEEFDKEFREHVAKDHEKAIKMFSDAAKDTKDPDVKQFAEKNLGSLKEHHEAASRK
jgi:putative membrane protein